MSNNYTTRLTPQLQVQHIVKVNINTSFVNTTVMLIHVSMNHLTNHERHQTGKILFREKIPQDETIDNLKNYCK